MEDSDDWTFEYDVEKDRSTLDSVLNCICELAQNPSDLVDSYRGYRALAFFTVFNVRHRYEIGVEKMDSLFLARDSKFYEYLWAAFKHLIEIRIEWVSEPARKYDMDTVEKNATLAERRQFILIGLLDNFNYLLDSTPTNALNLLLNRPDALRVFLSVLADADFVKQVQKPILDGLVANVGMLSSFASSNKQDWAKLKCIDVLLGLSKCHPKYQKPVYVIIARIATDGEIETMENVPEIISIFTNMIHENTFAPGQAVPFTDEELKVTVEVKMLSFWDPDSEVWSDMITILHSLYLLAVNDKLKYDIYKQMRDKSDPLKTLILKGESEVERQYAAQLLAQVCFDQRVAEDVARDEELCQCIDELCKGEKIVWKRLVKNCQEIQWLIRRHLEQTSELQSGTCKFDFMMSCSNESREMGLKIKSSLEQAGFSVWMDDESRAELLGRGVETSHHFLMCVTEKYRLSVKCRIEAEHAHLLGKTCVPLIIQKGYGSVDGWLGLRMKASKAVIDFSEEKYNKSLSQLLEQVHEL